MSGYYHDLLDPIENVRGFAKGTIKIVSRATAKAYKGGYPDLLQHTDVISINDPRDNYLFNPSQGTNILSLVYHDITPDHLRYDRYSSEYLFNKEHATEVINFLERRDSTKPLLVHCFAGISRSAATALFAGLMYGHDVEKLVLAHPRIYHNPWILQVLREVYKEEFGKTEDKKQGNYLDNLRYLD